ncbi:hypothetical protein SBA5_880001 [Candidatus Sulfotelmatomonas gaucii]|uniref:Uncharacterized protein n=1 Tax=Candidatus Sulfuritelmatomonas gaucii TaxID=2043161 RepID=A0A2N9M764_9BACT|nr:hypothetical protein SBA5_880001 [Candidatus Sulfotelmatomonas gaucii]
MACVVLAGSCHEVIASIKGLQPTPSNPLEKRLHEILDKFGFEVKHLREATHGAQDAVAGAGAASPA